MDTIVGGASRNRPDPEGSDQNDSTSYHFDITQLISKEKRVKKMGKALSIKF
jgi:hypothetical protein